MRIYGAEISGSLLVSGSAEFQENILVSGSMTVLGGINATISGTITDALVAEMAPKYTLTTSFHDFTSSYNTGSFTGSFKGDGNGLTNIPASGVTGLNLDRISVGSVTASISETNGLRVNTNTEITGTLKVTGEITSNGVGLISGSDQLTSSYDQRYILSGSITETTWDNVENKPSGIVSSSVQVSLTGTTGYSTFSSSIATTDSNQENRLSSLETASGSIRNDFNSYTSSNNSFTSSINTTIKNKLNTDGVISGSVQIDIASTTGYSTFSSSIATTDSNQNSRLNSLEGKTGSYSTTGSNKFVGDQTITGSLTVTQNLTVLGSSSLLIVTSSQLSVSSSTISVNVFEPAERFGGLKVYDSGSSVATASLLWDSLNNKWIYQNATGSGYSGGMLMMGPRNTGSLGDEVGTIANVVMKGQGGDHITGSNITDDGTNVRINSNTIITGSLVVTSTVSSTNITAIETSTSSLNSFTSSINTTIKNKLNTDGVISGSSQILLSSGIWSGSGQLPSGVVSGSSQVLAGTTIHSGSFFNGISVVSGSAQISFGGITGVPTGLVSGSSQITFSSISSIPTGLVSGSSQITLSSTSGFGTYINQALLTTSSPTFAGLNVNFSGTDQGVTINKVSGGSGQWNYIGFSNAGTRKAYFGIDSSGYATIGSDVSLIILQNNTQVAGNITPSTNGTLNLGSSTARWNTVFTSDLSMSNGIGDYTIVEGEEDLFIYNNKTNKVFKFLLQEVDPSTAPPKKEH